MWSGLELMRSMDSSVHWIFLLFFSFFFAQEETQRHAKEISSPRFLWSILLSLSVTVRAYRNKSLTLDGCIVAFLLGIIITCVNKILSFCIIFFLILGTKATRYAKNSQKQTNTHITPRNSAQVLCNGGLVALFSIIQLYLDLPEEYVIQLKPTSDTVTLYKNLTNIAALTSLTCATADTFSSELGSLSQCYPRLITLPWKKVPKGTNGGVTVWGIVMAGLGGFIIGLCYVICSFGFNFYLNKNQLNLFYILTQTPLLFIATLSGILGSLIDSIVGSIFQFSGFHTEARYVTDAPGHSVIHISGMNFLTNNLVNLVSCTLTSLIIQLSEFGNFHYSLSLWARPAVTLLIPVLSKQMCSPEDLVQYIVLRCDLTETLQWSLGSIIAQACHACVAATIENINDLDTRSYLNDLDSMRKIVLQVPNEESLRLLADKLRNGGISYKLWIEQPEGVATCLATSAAPRKKIVSYFKSLKLFVGH